MFFLYAAIVSLIKSIFYIKKHKTLDLKLQHWISRNNLFSSYLENAKSKNVLM